MDVVLWYLMEVIFTPGRNLFTEVLGYLLDLLLIIFSSVQPDISLLNTVTTVIRYNKDQVNLGQVNPLFWGSW